MTSNTHPGTETASNVNKGPLWHNVLDQIKQLTFKDQDNGNGFLVAERQLMHRPFEDGTFADIGVLSVQVMASRVNRELLLANVDLLANARCVKAVLATLGQHVEWPENIAPMVRDSAMWRAPRLPYNAKVKISVEDAMELWNAVSYELGKLNLIEKVQQSAVAMRSAGRAAYWAAPYAGGRSKRSFVTLDKASMSPEATELLKETVNPFRMMVIEAKVVDGKLEWSHSASVPTMNSGGVMIAPAKWLGADGKKSLKQVVTPGLPALITGGASMPLISRTAIHGLRMAHKSAEALGVGGVSGADVVKILGLFADEFQPRYTRATDTRTQLCRAGVDKALKALKMTSVEAEGVVETFSALLTETAGLSLTQRHAAQASLGEARQIGQRPWIRSALMAVATQPSKLSENADANEVLVSMATALLLGSSPEEVREHMRDLAAFCKEPEEAYTILQLVSGCYPQEISEKLPTLSSDIAKIEGAWNGMVEFAEAAENPDAPMSARRGSTPMDERAINRVDALGMDEDVMNLMLLSNEEDEEESAEVPVETHEGASLLELEESDEKPEPIVEDVQEEEADTEQPAAPVRRTRKKKAEVENA